MDIVEVNNRLLTILAKLFGYAAKPMASALEKKGGTLTGSPARFISQRNEGSGTITIGPLPRECRKRMERDPAPGAAAEAKPLGSASCPGVTISKRSESSGTTKWSLCRTSAGNESLLAYHSFLASFPVTCEYVTYSEKWYKGKRVNVLLVRITHQDFGAVAAHRFA